ncbi:MAG: relaxase/mobilization nuclease domain-containing protein [Tissierellaceae bacterium]|jgi:hypothetical protein
MAVFKDTEKRKNSNNYRTPQNKASLKRAVEYIAREDKIGEIDGEKIDELLKQGHERVLDYVSQKNKTNSKLITGINCNPSSAFDDMMMVKMLHNNTGGRQFKHFVHSYSKYEDDLTPEMAHEISLKLLEHEKFKGFQILASTHVDEDHLHTHFVINSVNMETGLKWQHSTKDMEEIRAYSNQLCKEYGLSHSFVNTKTNKYNKSKSMDIGEDKARQEGRSWKYEAWLTINECRKISTSKEEFIENMEKLNYKVRWVDERKNITFTLPNGRKLNNDKLHPPERFTKEALLNQFQLNKEYQERRKEFNAKIKSQNLQELYFRTIKFLFENPDEGDKDYPMTYLEGQALREKMIEEAKGRGLDWEKEK